MTMPSIQAEAPAIRVDPDGTMRVGGSRVIVDLVIQSYLNGASAESIVQAYTSISLAEAYSVIAYYLRHRQEMDAYLAEKARTGAYMRDKLAAMHGDVSLIRDRLLARNAADQ
jgi:uncharacterized protein (DUF433 family)